MRHHIIYFSLLFLPSLIFANPNPTRVQFFEGSISSLEENALKEGKLYFVEFVASWCMPCRWMDETTFSDPTLAQYVASHYLAMKVDIDNFDGFALKQQYDVKLLPTILIFSSKGQLLAKYEESLSPTKMLSILERHNMPRYRSTPETSEGTPTSYSAGIYRPGLRPDAAPGKLNNAAPAFHTDKKPQVRIESPAEATASGEGLFRFNVSRQPSNGYSVQVGVYENYGNVLLEVSKFQEIYNEPIIVHIDALNGKRVYKVLIGHFDIPSLATTFKKQLVALNPDAFIKDLATLK